MGKTLAICGKGGAGKTTIAAIIARRLRQENRRALIIDADPAGGLGYALGLRPKRTLNDIRTATIRAAREGGDRQELSLTADFLLLEAVLEVGPLAFLSIGLPETKGCYCEINRLLRDVIETLASQFDVTVIDGEAGVEQVNRQVMHNLDSLWLISDSSPKGLHVAEAISETAARFELAQRVGIVLNRVREGDLERARQSTSLPIVAAVPVDETLLQFDAEGRSLFALPDCSAVLVVETAWKSTLSK